MSLSQTDQATLKQKSDQYISLMEARDKGVDYDKVTTDRLLILEAINDWSGRALTEGGEVEPIHGGDDPCCATAVELNELLTRMHGAPVIFYPVSGFLLSDQGELRFYKLGSSYRMVPHLGDSRADAISIAETKHIQDVEAAMQLWVFCATEDCMAYLEYQMDTHNLSIEEEESASVRRIVTSYLQEYFSIGQVWNAMWRSVQQAAALSTRQHFNNAKAAKTIPKKIDKVLASMVGNPAFTAYDRIVERPLGAMLALFFNRFGITDITTGTQVREKFIISNSLELQDEGQMCIHGCLYFFKKFTELDRILLSCFKGMETDTDEPEWDNSHVIGKISYSMSDMNCFDGWTFAIELFARLGVSPPTNEDIGRHAAAANNHRNSMDEFVDESGWSGAIKEILAKGGISEKDVGRVSRILRGRTSPCDLVGVMGSIPIPAGFYAARVKYAYVFKDCIDKSDNICVDGLNLSISEECFEPDGSDQDVVMSVANKNIDNIADILVRSILNSISSDNYAQRCEILSLVGKKLLERVEHNLT